MLTYRCYFLNKADAIVGVAEIACADDEDARQAALKLLRERPSHAVEVWDRARKLLRHMREPL